MDAQKEAKIESLIQKATGEPLDTIGEIGSKTLLYVDDEDGNLTLFQMFFQYSDISAVIFDNAADALVFLELNPEIKYIVSDIRMPGINGWDFADWISEKYNTFGIEKNILLFTAYEWDELEKRVDVYEKYKGVRGILSKDVGLNGIRDQIVELIEKY